MHALYITSKMGRKVKKKEWCVEVTTKSYKAWWWWNKW